MTAAAAQNSVLARQRPALLREILPGQTHTQVRPDSGPTEVAGWSGQPAQLLATRPDCSMCVGDIHFACVLIVRALLNIHGFDFSGSRSVTTTDECSWPAGHSRPAPCTPRSDHSVQDKMEPAVVMEGPSPLVLGSVLLLFITLIILYLKPKSSIQPSLKPPRSAASIEVPTTPGKPSVRILYGTQARMVGAGQQA